MPDATTRAVNERLRALDKRLQGIYDEAYKTAVSNEKAAIKKLASLDADALRSQGLSDTTIRAKQLAFKTQVERATNITNNISAEIARSGEMAAKIIRGEQLNIYDISYRGALSGIDKQLGFEVDWTIYDKNQLKVLLDSDQSPFTKVAYKKMGSDNVIVNRLQNELTQSVILGEGTEKIARRIRDVTGQSLAQARRVARTEIIRTSNQGRSLGFNQAHDDYGIEMEKQWIATLDARTRQDHAEMHMEKAELDKKFSNGLMFPGDPDGGPAQVVNCRCAMVSVLKGLKGSKAYQELNEKIGKKEPDKTPLEKVEIREAVFTEIEVPWDGW